MIGDSSEEMKDDRVVGGAGAKRIEVSRSGRSRFEVTYRAQLGLVHETEGEDTYH
jgi:hypothetical protein